MVLSINRKKYKFILNSDSILSMVLSVFVFVLLVDPTNTIFRIKGLIFVFLIALSAIHYGRIRIKELVLILTIFLIVVITFILGYISVYSFNLGFTLAVLKGFSTLILLLWIDKFKMIDKLVFPSLVICFLVIATFLIFLYNNKLANILYVFYMKHDATMMIGKRAFLGVHLMSFFYKTLPVLLIPASIYSYRFFNGEENKVRNFLIMSIILFVIFLGGTRASMLAGILTFTFGFIMWLSRRRVGKLILIPLIIGFMAFFCYLTLLLILEKGEKSNKVKYDTLDSYSELLIKHPSILAVGQGAGSMFYSEPRKEMVFVTELSYLELFRMFGIVGASVVIVTFFFPLYLIYKKRKILKYSVPVFIGYTLYLFVGGTNPLLLGSTGMLVLLTAYSFSMNPFYEKEKW